MEQLTLNKINANLFGTVARQALCLQLMAVTIKISYDFWLLVPRC